ncbi:MAG: hypothetical protein QW334_01020 [Thermofilum sp.]
MRLMKPKDRVLACVDKGLSHLGETIKHVVYWYLENECGLKKEEIPEKPEEFITGLEKMYGPGARVIEMNILSEMRSEFGINSESFIKAVRKTGKLKEEKG